MGFIRRSYQEETYNNMIEYFKGEVGVPSLVVLPTGAGKSYAIVDACNLAKEKGAVLVLQPSIELLNQNFNKYIASGGEASIYSTSASKKEVGRVTFATLGSIKDYDLFKEVRTLIIDECHYKYPPKEGSQIVKLLNTLSIDYMLGLTATPYMLSEDSLVMLDRLDTPIFKDYLQVTQVSEMIEGKFWANIEYEDWDFDEGTLAVGGRDFTKDSIKRYILKNSVNESIVRRVLKLQKEGKSVLVFTDSVESAEIMQTNIPNSALVKGGTKKSLRDQSVKGFLKNEISVLINYGTFITGFDKPDLDVVIMGRPTNSLAIYYQVLGRGVRNPLYPKQKQFRMIDFGNNRKRFGDVKDMTIEKREDGWGVFIGEKMVTGLPIQLKMTHQEFLNMGVVADDYPTNSDRWAMLGGSPKWYVSKILAKLDSPYSYVPLKDKPRVKRICQAILLDKLIPKPELNTVALLDLNNVSHFLNSRGGMTKKGLDNYINEIRRRLRVEEVKVFSDSKRSSYWRKEVYSEYKKNREIKNKDEKFIKNLVTFKKSIDICETKDRLEADDLIGEVVRSLEYKKVYIISNDSDFKQLTFFKNTQRVNPDSLRLLGGGKVEAIETLVTKILKGDRKDNVPKSHKQGRIMTTKLKEALREICRDISDFYTRTKNYNVEETPFEEYILKTLDKYFDIDKEQYRINYKILTLIQKKYD